MGIVGGVLGVGSALLGMSSANKQAKAATSAANTQAAATRYSTDIQKAMFDQMRKDQQPYMNAGSGAIGRLVGGLAPNGQFMKTYTGQNIYNDPSYQFRLNEGLDAVESGAAAQGGLLSGATLKALQNYGQDYASQEFGNAYNRFNADQTNQYNRLSSLVNLGQNAAAGVGSAGMQTGQAIANNTMAGANAQAAGTIASANAKAQGQQALLGGLGNLAGMFI